VHPGEPHQRIDRWTYRAESRSTQILNDIDINPDTIIDLAVY
jgi:hypothetical protein